MRVTEEKLAAIRAACKTKLAKKAGIGAALGPMTGLPFGGVLGAALGAAADMKPGRVYKGNPALNAAVGYQTGRLLGRLNNSGGKGALLGAFLAEAGARSVPSESQYAQPMRDLSKRSKGLQTKLLKLVKNNKKAALALGVMGAAGYGAKKGTMAVMKSRDLRKQLLADDPGMYKTANIMSTLIPMLAKNTALAGAGVGTLHAASSMGKMNKRLGSLKRIQKTFSRGGDAFSKLTAHEASIGRKLTKAERKAFLSKKEYKRLKWRDRAAKATDLRGQGKWKKTNSSWDPSNLQRKYKNFGRVIGKKKIRGKLLSGAAGGAMLGGLAQPLVQRMAGGGAMAAAKKYALPVGAGVAAGALLSRRG